MENQESGSNQESQSGARRTPYELVFGLEEFEARIFPGIEAESRAHGVDATNLKRFTFLSRAGDAVRKLVPEVAPPEALEQYRALLFHAYNFWCYGKRVFLLERSLARFLVEAVPQMEEWELALPYPSIYLQLPANLFWGSVSPEDIPEPIDGFFITCCSGTDGLGKPFHHLEVLAVLGIRRDRAGFSVIPFSTEAGPGIPAPWAEAAARGEGKDFENMLPGGELSGLYSILTTAEALKLIARTFWYAEAHPENVHLEVESERRATDRSGSPPLARLPFHRVCLGDAGPSAPAASDAEPTA